MHKMSYEESNQIVPYTCSMYDTRVFVKVKLVYLFIMRKSQIACALHRNKKKLSSAVYYYAPNARSLASIPDHWITCPWCLLAPPSNVLSRVSTLKPTMNALCIMCPVISETFDGQGPVTCSQPILIFGQLHELLTSITKKNRSALSMYFS